MKRSILLLICCLILTIISLNADTIIDDRYNNEYSFNESEFTRAFVETSPPIGPVRPVGEFEPASHVLIRYPLGIPVSLVAQLANVAQVICIVGSASTQSQATTAFQNAGVNMNKVTFFVTSTNSYWTRDYGPFFVFDGNNQLGVVDFPYNRPSRPYDDEVPRTFASTYSYPLFGMNVIQTGGNYMNDGVNSAAQTTLVYTENSSQTVNQIRQKMQEYLGVTNYYAIQDPNNNYIQHIDCWGKYLAPDKVLIRSVPTNHAQYNAIESVADYFASLNCAWGYPYKVYRVNTPENQPYTNSLILNKNVFVPIMSSPYDSAALQVYRDALPGYNVIGILGASSTPWASTDALHCRTHEVPDKQMLYINHMPYHGEVMLQDNYSFASYIFPHSNMSLYSDSLYISYKINQGQWYLAPLTDISENNFVTNIGNLAPGDTIRYYIHAADMSGRSINHPLTGKDDPHKFWVAVDNTPPNITHNPLLELYSDQLPVTISAYVYDNYAVDSVYLYYKVDNNEEQVVQMEAMGNNMWITTFSPVILPQSQFLYYKIAATDSSNPSNTGYSPASGLYTVDLYPISNIDNNNTTMALQSVYPNPFNSKTEKSITISYNSPSNSQISFRVFNIKGQEVKNMTMNTKSSGNQLLNWNGKDNQNRALAAGIYFVKMNMSDRVWVKKLMIMD